MSQCVRFADDSGSRSGRAWRELLPFSSETSKPSEKKVKNEANREMHKFMSEQGFGDEHQEVARNRSQFRVVSSLPCRRGAAGALGPWLDGMRLQ